MLLNKNYAIPKRPTMRAVKQLNIHKYFNKDQWNSALFLYDKHNNFVYQVPLVRSPVIGLNVQVKDVQVKQKAQSTKYHELNVLVAALKERFMYRFPQKTASISCIVPVENEKASSLRGYSPTSKCTCWRKEDTPVQHYWTPIVGSHCCKLLWQVRQECSHIIYHSSQVVCSSLPHNHDDVLPSVFP